MGTFNSKKSFKGAPLQFKSKVYPIEVLKHNIEDHQLK